MQSLIIAVKTALGLFNDLITASTSPKHDTIHQ